MQDKNSITPFNKKVNTQIDADNGSKLSVVKFPTADNVSDATAKKTKVLLDGGQDDADNAKTLLAEFKSINKYVFLFDSEIPFLTRFHIIEKHKVKRVGLEPLTVDRLKSEITEKLDLSVAYPNRENVQKIRKRIPKDIFIHIYNNNASILTQYFNMVRGVKQHHIIGKNGKPTTDFGYDAESELYINCNVKIDERMKLKEAVDLINEIIRDFPFTDDASHDNTVAIPFTEVMKPYIDDLTPLFLVQAPQEGTGKTLLIEALLAGLNGERPASCRVPIDNEEMGKTLLAEVIAGASYIFFDNIPDGLKFDFSSVSHFVTASIYKGRILGFSETTKAKKDATLYLTGNNPSYGREVARRLIPINLECKQENKDYEHPQLINWCMKERGRILSAIFAVVREWQSEGSPKYKGELLPSFEEWTRVIGGIMQFAGWGNFLKNQNEQYENAVDADYAGCDEFLEAAFRKQDSFKIKDLIPFAIDAGVIVDGSQRSNETQLGLELKHMSKRNIHGYTIKKINKRNPAEYKIYHKGEKKGMEKSDE
jgi:hypothetical protein